MQQHLAAFLLALAFGAALPVAPVAAQGRKPATAAPADASRAEHRVVLSNRSRRTIEQVLISPSSESSWGSDLLGTEVIDTGAQATVTYVGACRADVQVVFEGGASEARRRVDVCQNSTLVIEPGWTLNPGLGGRSQ